MPTIEEMHLEEPQIVKQGNRFGVRLQAHAPSIHMIKADIETEIAPFVGTEKQSEELVNYILNELKAIQIDLDLKFIRKTIKRINGRRIAKQT